MLFKKNVQYIAKTDGHLQSKRRQTFSLIEVKPRKRAGDVAIRVQESAQIAAWISHNEVKSHDPETNCRYLLLLRSCAGCRLTSCSIFLLSQDKDEIYVTFPYFTKAYGKDDKKVADLQERDFLCMREYGPFRLRSKEDVRNIASFLHAYTHHVSKR